jgi:hypothetical protein
MPTEIPAIFSEEHDFTAVDASFKAIQARSNAKLALGVGLGILAAGVGVGAAAFGLSFLFEKEILEVPQIVTETKVERVEIPKIVEVPKIVETTRVVEKPVAVQQPPAPVVQPAPTPRLGDRTTDQEFQNSEEFKTAEFNGRIISVTNGLIKFSNGQSLTILDSNGVPLNSPTTNGVNGMLAYCHEGGVFANGRHRWPCLVNHNGRVKKLMDLIDRASGGEVYHRNSNNSDLFTDLFGEE